MFLFGSGVLIGTPSGGGAPVNFGLVQEVSLDTSVSVKELYGQYNYPVAVGAGERKLTGKAKMARISGLALGTLFFGVTPQAGMSMTQFGEATAAPTAAPYTYAVANKASFLADQGVVYAATGLPFKLVTTAPAQGQYSVAAGVYTFAAADSGAAILLSYTYAVPSTGQSIAVNQGMVGPTTSFSANLFQTDPTTGKQFSVLLYACVASKLTLATKITDFTIPEFDFTCFANAAGQVMQLNFGDTA